MPTNNVTSKPYDGTSPNESSDVFDFDIYDGGPAVDRTKDFGHQHQSIGPTDTYHKKIAICGDVNDENDLLSIDIDKLVPSLASGGKAEYYGGEDFDDLIRIAIEPTKNKSNSETNNLLDEDTDSFVDDGGFDEGDSEEYEPSSKSQEAVFLVDSTPNDKSSLNTDTGSDENSLNSDDISGGSEVSDVREKASSQRQKYFIPPPLINDDESTVDMRPPAPINQSVSSYVESLNRQQIRKGRLIKFALFLLFVGTIAGIILAIVLATGGRNIDGSGNRGTEVEALEVKNTDKNLESKAVSDVTSYPSDSPSVSRMSTVISPTSQTLHQTISPTTSFPMFEATTALETASPVSASISTVEPSKNPITTAPTIHLPTSPPSKVPISAEPTLHPATPLPSQKIISAAPTLHPATPLPSKAPVSATPTLHPATLLPSQNIFSAAPTLQPVIPLSTADPSKAYTQNPTSSPTKTITSYPTPNPTLLPLTNSPTPQPSLRPITAPLTNFDTSSNDSYFCATVSYTSNWNILLNFNCSLACPGMSNTECPNNYQCKKTADSTDCLQG